MPSTETIIFCGTDPDGVAPFCRHWLPHVGHINLIATMGIIFCGTDCGEVVFLLCGAGCDKPFLLLSNLLYDDDDDGHHTIG